MLVIEGARDIYGQVINLKLENDSDEYIDASQLTILPAVIDPHVHFRVPGMEYKEDWRTGAKAAICGGCTMVFDMPNTKPPTFTAIQLADKKALIDSQLQEVGIPLHYQLFFGADKHHLHEIATVQNQVVGIKVFMGCSTGNLVIDDDESLHAVFEIAAKLNMLVAVHAEDETLIKARKQNFHGAADYADHSTLRNEEVACVAVEKAISLTRQYGTRLYVLHMSTADEVELIRKAKKDNLPVFAETTPHHLFLDTTHYARLYGKAVVNPPLRDSKHHAALWQAIKDGVIDTIGSDHAPHTLEEKNQTYGACPSGMPGIEFMLPLLLNASHHGRISLAQIVSLTSARAKHIFQIQSHSDYVLVDLNRTDIVSHTVSKCGWSSYEGMQLTGWPIYTVLGSRCYQVSAGVNGTNVRIFMDGFYREAY